MRYMSLHPLHQQRKLWVLLVCSTIDSDILQRVVNRIWVVAEDSAEKENIYVIYCTTKCQE